MDATMRILSTNIGDVTTRLEVMALLNAGKTARAEQVARAALQKAGVAGVVGGRNAAPPQ
jgi:ABC-type branched-subunit amino acid transport system substrate-binding protein